jgi:hypothetical protein
MIFYNYNLRNELPQNYNYYINFGVIINKMTDDSLREITWE